MLLFRILTFFWLKGTFVVIQSLQFTSGFLHSLNGTQTENLFDILNQLDLHF